MRIIKMCDKCLPRGAGGGGVRRRRRPAAGTRHITPQLMRLRDGTSCPTSTCTSRADGRGAIDRGDRAVDFERGDRSAGPECVARHLAYISRPQRIASRVSRSRAGARDQAQRAFRQSVQSTTHATPTLSGSRAHPRAPCTTVHVQPNSALAVRAPCTTVHVQPNSALAAAPAPAGSGS